MTRSPGVKAILSEAWRSASSYWIEGWRPAGVGGGDRVDGIVHALRAIEGGRISEGDGGRAWRHSRAGAGWAGAPAASAVVGRPAMARLTLLEVDTSWPWPTAKIAIRAAIVRHRGESWERRKPEDTALLSRRRPSLRGDGSSSVPVRTLS